MQRNYFIFKADYEINYPDMKYPIIIPKGQPMKVDRILDEYNYLFIIDNITCETSLNYGYFTETITKKQEAEMYKILMNYYKSNLFGYYNSRKINHLRQDNLIDKLWAEISQKEKTIEALRNHLNFQVEQKT